MPEDPASQPLFDEKEISAILKRAVAIQGADGPEPSFGLTLTELKQLAAEAGIDPEAVATAARERMQGDAPVDRPNLWGGPLRLMLERVVAGEVDDVVWEEMVTEARRAFNDPGIVRSRGWTREWTHSGQGGVRAHVTTTARNGQTRIQVFWHEPATAGAFFVPALILSAIMLPVVFEALALVSPTGVALYVAIVGTLWALARWILSRVAGKKKRMVRGLTERLVAISTEAPAATDAVKAPPEAVARTEPRLRLEADGSVSEVEAEAPRAARSRTT